MTRIFIDFEFLEDGRTIDPISVGMVAEDGREYYAIVDSYTTRDPANPSLMDRVVAHDWLRANVVPSLPIRIDDSGAWWWDGDHADALKVKPREQIADEVRDFIRETPDVELWAWYASYDHVCLAQLFGRMIDLPSGVPMWTNDLKQEAVRLGVSEDDLPKQEFGVHNALADARHNKRLAEYLDGVALKGGCACA